MASLTPTFFTVGLSYFTDLPACVCLQCVYVCEFACVGKGPFYPLFLLFLCLSLSLCLSLLMWVIDMQQRIPGSYRRVCSHGYCGVLAD